MTALEAILEEGRDRGFLGPGPVLPHIEHARRLTSMVLRLASAGPLHALDLGSGGGLPGLVLAWDDASVSWVLLDAAQKRTEFLRDAVQRLGLEPRVQVVNGRAEQVGRDPQHRGRYGLVTARSFAGPAVTAECGSPLLRTGGRLAVSEPPTPEPGRWPAAELAGLGLRPMPAEGSWAVFERFGACPERYPRRVGVPARRPLW